MFQPDCIHQPRLRCNATPLLGTEQARLDYEAEDDVGGPRCAAERGYGKVLQPVRGFEQAGEDAVGEIDEADAGAVAVVRRPPVREADAKAIRSSQERRPRRAG